MCNCCKYDTMDSSNWHKHKLSKRHEKLAKISIEKVDKDANIITIDRIEVKSTLEKLIQCEICGKTFTRKWNLQQHIEGEKCSDTDKLTWPFRKEILNLREKYAKIRDENTELHGKISSYEKIVLAGNGKSTVNHVSIQNYIQANFNNAPPLKAIENYNNLSKDCTDDMIDALMYNQNHGTLPDYLGNYLINFYKKDNPSEQSIWNSDLSRLTYYVRELLTENNTVWAKDGKGHKFKEIVVSPLLKYLSKDVCNAIRKFSNEMEKIVDSCEGQEFLGNLEYNRLNDRLESLNNIQTAIQDGSLAKDIIRYVAPQLYLNKELTGIEFVSTQVTKTTGGLVTVLEKINKQMTTNTQVNEEEDDESSQTDSEDNYDSDDSDDLDLISAMNRRVDKLYKSMR